MKCRTPRGPPNSQTLTMLSWTPGSLLKSTTKKLPMGNKKILNLKKEFKTRPQTATYKRK